MNAHERRCLAVTDLHEPFASADTDVLGRSDCNPILAHAAPGTKHAQAMTIGIGHYEGVAKSICTVAG